MTFVGALRCKGVTAPLVLDGPMNAASFLAYAGQVLVPTLRPWRHRGHGQPVFPQRDRDTPGPVRGRCEAVLPAALQPGPLIRFAAQAHRADVRKAENPAPQSG